MRINLGNASPIKTFGSSILPPLHDGDIIYFRKVSFSNIKTHDVVLVNRDNKYFTHRVIYKADKYLITKGDNKNYSDGKMLPNHIVGRVYQIKRGKEIFPVESLSLIQNASYLQEIVRITRLFHKENIDLVFLKGLPIHLYYTGKMPERIYVDCDVLVSAKDFHKAEAVFVEAGYTYLEQEFTKIHSWLRGNSKSEKSYVKNVRNFPVVFDLHREPTFQVSKLGHIKSLYPKKLLDKLTDTMLDTKRIVRTKYGTFPILSPYNLVVYLAIHLVNHNYQGAFQHDLFDTVIQKEIGKNLSGWNQTEEMIKRYSLGRLVYPSFSLLKKYYHTYIPTRFLSQLKDSSVHKDIGKINIFETQNIMQDRIQRFKYIYSF